MMLELDHVKKTYKGFHLDCSLNVEEGCITGLIGQNGAGKSTTFKAILGVIRTDGGSIRIFGKDSRDILIKDKEDIGVVLSESGFSGWLTIREILPVMQNLYAKFDRQEFVKQCEHFQLPLNKKIKEFSTGMKAKLKILLAMSYNARLLVLDEPTAGLDVVVREEIMDMLRNYMQEDGRAILISSHISSDLEGFCDDIYMIHEGKIVLHEDTDALLSCYGVLKVDREQFQKLDKRYLSKIKKEIYGYSCLTDQKQYYMDNYPQIVVEKGDIDQIMMMMIRGGEGV